MPVLRRNFLHHAIRKKSRKDADPRRVPRKELTGEYVNVIIGNCHVVVSRLLHWKSASLQVTSENGSGAVWRTRLVSGHRFSDAVSARESDGFRGWALPHGPHSACCRKAIPRTEQLRIRRSAGQATAQPTEVGGKR